MRASRDETRVVELLAKRGLLLVQDPELPSVVGLLLGGTLRSSWWGHPNAQRVFDALTALGDRDDVLFTKLRDGPLHRPKSAPNADESHSPRPTERIC